MKLRDFQFFLSVAQVLSVALWATALLLTDRMLIAQPTIGPASSLEGDQGDLLVDRGSGQSEFYKRAEQQFGGPSFIRLIEAGQTGLENWTAPSSIGVQAVVLDWNDKELWVVRRDSVDKVLLPSPRILSVDVHWLNPAGDQLRGLLQDRKYGDAIALGSQLLSSKDESLMLPRWQQRAAISLLVQASKGMDRWERASLLYVSLAKSQSPSLLHASIPIPWTNSSATIRERPKLQELAVGWLNDPVESVQLLGAAWLLDGSSRSEAMTVLNRLAKQATETWVKQYAEVQLWRTVAPNQITSETLERWTKLRDAIHFPLQAGPTFLLADKLSTGNQTVRASEEWMRIILLHGDHPVLQDQAKLAVKPLLESVGDNSTVQFLTNTLDK